MPLIFPLTDEGVLGFRGHVVLYMLGVQHVLCAPVMKGVLAHCRNPSVPGQEVGRVLRVEGWMEASNSAAVDHSAGGRRLPHRVLFIAQSRWWICKKKTDMVRLRCPAELQRVSRLNLSLAWPLGLCPHCNRRAHGGLFKSPLDAARSRSAGIIT